MSNGDYGYFGKGDMGYAQYMTAFQPQLRRLVRRRWWWRKPQQQWRWRRGRQRVRLPDRYCSGRGADPDRLGWLNQSLQVKHRFFPCGGIFLNPLVESNGLW